MIWTIITVVLYYLPLIVGILGTVHLLYKNERDREWGTLFIALILSCIPMVNIVYAAFILDEHEV